MGGERDRWHEMASSLGEKLINITGDVLLSAGMVAYLGAFNVVYRLKRVTRLNFLNLVTFLFCRKEILKNWMEICTEALIKCSSDFTLTNSLGEPVVIREWQIYGLPKVTE